MLGLMLLAAAVAAAAVIVVYVSGTITRSKLKEELRNNEIENAIVTAVDHCGNVVSLEDVDSGKTLEIHGDGVDYELDKGNRICVNQYGL